MKKLFPFLLLVLLLAACGSDDCCKKGGETTTEAMPELLNGPRFFGEKITEEGAIDFAMMQEKMLNSDSMDLKVAGKIKEVCQKKGCWMTLTAADNDEDEIFVKFKDYGFFMPMDASGQNVIMDGYAIKETVSVDELRHYAEDAGKSEEEIAAITEPKDEVNFMARGVIFTDK